MIQHFAKANQPTRLLSLPPELRNTIYRLDFAEDPDRTEHWICLWPTIRDRVRALMNTCSQICRETGSIYYAERTFMFVWENDLLLFSRALSLSKRRVTQSLRAAFMSGATVETAGRRLKRVHAEMVICGLAEDIKMDVLSAEVVLLPNQGLMSLGVMDGSMLETRTLRTTKAGSEGCS